MPAAGQSIHFTPAHLRHPRSPTRQPTGLVGHAAVYLARRRLWVDHDGGCVQLGERTEPFELNSALDALSSLGYSRVGFHVAEARVLRRNMRAAGCTYWPCDCKGFVTEATTGDHQGPTCGWPPPEPAPFKPPTVGDKHKLYFNGHWWPTTVVAADEGGVSVKWNGGYPGRVQEFTAAEWTRRSGPAAPAVSPAGGKRKRGA